MRTEADPPATTKEAAEPTPVSLVFWASFLGLFLELALIRWVSSEIRVFAYCKNLVLVASFLGFGTGCFLSRRRVDLVRGMFVLLLLTLLVRLPGQLLHEFGPQRVSNILAELSGFMIFQEGVALPWNVLGRLAFAAGWTAAIFFVVAFIMVPFGQIVAAAISRLESPVYAYSINVAGSLAGILSYTLLTTISAPPLAWFVPVVLGSLYLKRGRASASQGLVGVALALTLVLLPDQGEDFKTYWSTYQKLTVFPGRQPGVAWHILVNNTGFQNLQPQPALPAAGPIPVDRFTMPYAVRRPPGRVLIVGAGTGNDAAAALLAGAEEVVAVEIDRKIYELGVELHPQAPYSNPRVEVVIDDARNYLKSTDRSFDVVVFSHLDSHTLLSSYTNVRLDNYIYTVEAFREARSRLAPGGLLYVSFFAQEPFVGRRLAKNLTAAFDHSPVFLRAISNKWDLAFNVYFLIGEGQGMAQLEERAATWKGFEILRDAAGDIAPTTDAWPFLPLEKRGIPPFIALMSILIILLSLAFALKARPRGEAFDGRVFWLGAAFMLVEVHNVSRLALVFGTTWHVNAWVIGVILGLILLANATFLALKRAGRAAGRWAVGGLFASLAAAYLVPSALFLGSAGAAGKVAATLLLSAPIYFAGLVFAEAFARSAAPGFALGWNILGAVVGGMTENLSYVFGIPALVPLAAAFYLAALIWPRLQARRFQAA